ncbi:MAG: hypothetical protein HY428_01905 [Candidatus Levybacteria bacterium]|nr:hypothetical protein [Candidatus Levybacteria bacterium]
MPEIPAYVPLTDRAETLVHLGTTLAEGREITIVDMHQNLANITATRVAEGWPDALMRTADYTVGTEFFQNTPESSQLWIDYNNKGEKTAWEFRPTGESMLIYWIGGPEGYSSDIEWTPDELKGKLQIVHDVFVASAPVIALEP